MNEQVRIYVNKNSTYCESIKYGTKYRFCHDRSAFCVVDRIVIDDLVETFVDEVPSDMFWSGVRF